MNNNNKKTFLTCFLPSRLTETRGEDEITRAVSRLQQALHLYIYTCMAPCMLCCRLRNTSLWRFFGDRRRTFFCPLLLLLLLLQIHERKLDVYVHVHVCMYLAGQPVINHVI